MYKVMQALRSVEFDGAILPEHVPEERPRRLTQLAICGLRKRCAVCEKVNSAYGALKLSQASYPPSKLYTSENLLLKTER